MRAVLCLVAAALMWGLNFHLLKIMIGSVHVMEAGFWRYLFAVCSLVFLLRKDVAGWAAFRANSKGVLLVGLLGLFCFNLFLFSGLNHTTSINASLVMSLNPVATILVARLFLKTNLSPRQIAAAILGVTGVIYLVSKGNIHDLRQLVFLKGDLLVVIAMLLSAGYNSWVTKYRGALDNQSFTFFTNLICLLAFVVILPFFAHPRPMEYETSFWIAAVTFGVLGTGVTYLLWNYGLSRLGASRAGVFMNIIPLATAATAVLFGEELMTYHYVSGALILVALLVAQRFTGR
ncbi:membrane protein [Parapedobacter pyrenivorans]|uniref:Membrane protein n=1 Tax=Parapedobacter pyrenivorans TaxID=1305674 RepID=A0A917M639_9SPHI|nr:DMT family transporter [Parapedobacter pyrenivorans]GGG79704.1 membrane protein [Parapedobacter pyrenivorans]